MTYAQLRRHLSTVARFGDEGAPTSAFPVGRWLELRGAGCVEFVGMCDRWTVTRLGLTILSHRAMPARQHQPRRTPSCGHAISHQHQTRIA